MQLASVKVKYRRIKSHQNNKPLFIYNLLKIKTVTYYSETAATIYLASYFLHSLVRGVRLPITKSH